jgi:alkyldihydroxyacetonephosphate synthase
MFGFGEEPVEPVPAEEVVLTGPRIELPEGREGLFTSDRHERLVHSLGKAYRDVVRGHRGEFENPPDVVAFPADREEVELVLERADSAGAAVIPFGDGFCSRGRSRVGFGPDRSRGQGSGAGGDVA